jgi:ADP-ribose pyrophosphatase YjhB (NUDIX family)
VSWPRASCGVVIRRGGKILLLHRRTAPEAGHWGLPGGKVDWMEPVETAAARELMEETGIEAGPLTLLCVADHIDEAAGDHFLAPIYTADAASGEPRVCEPHKHIELGWFDPADPPSPLTITARAALGALL